MDIRINKLTLQNFKGIKSLVINADGNSLDIFGDNATGKTTVFDAFTWLLFGKDSLGRADFGIKTQDSNGNVIHNLEHSVECELAIPDQIRGTRCRQTYGQAHAPYRRCSPFCRSAIPKGRDRRGAYRDQPPLPQRRNGFSCWSFQKRARCSYPRRGGAECRPSFSA